MHPKAFQQRAEKLGQKLDERSLERFLQLEQELRLWNERVNLTAITKPDEIERRHFLDSLSCLLAFADLLEETPTGPLIDVGSGAGFPGIPIKLARPELRVTLLDSALKKTTFIEHLIGVLQLDGVTVVRGRAETVGHDSCHRERYLVAVSRAIASLPTLVELCLPFVQVGGRLVAPRRGDLEVEARAARGAMAELGGEVDRIIPVEIVPGETNRGLVVVRKVSFTPHRYARREGTPRRRPLEAGG